MDIWLKFVLLLIAAYILGSIPLSYLSGRSRGVDIKKQGTQQVGAGNLWRTTSRKLGFFVGIYDFLKGMLMIYLGDIWGLNPSLQLVIGIAVIIGHNWPVFLRFHGGRGIATMLGIIIILPSINTSEITTWPLITFFAVAVAVLLVAHRTPVPILAGLICLPIASAIAGERVTLTLGYLALVLVIIIKRLTAQPNSPASSGNIGQVLLNRFLFDRDVRDRAAWVNRKLAEDEDVPE
jgi:acyl phosphate:glycerol-3-phosphate acyltransferase